jgi:acylphosphatase
MAMRSVIILVSGKVQGVFYRESTRTKAGELGIKGTVRNLDDGRVELKATGTGDAIKELIAWCRSGPPAARVDDLEVDPLDEFMTQEFTVIR